MAQLVKALWAMRPYFVAGLFVLLILVGAIRLYDKFTETDYYVQGMIDYQKLTDRLEAKGFSAPVSDKPEVKDRPRGSRPVAVVQGAVRYPALEPGKVPGTDVDAVPPSRSLVPGTDPLCDLDRIAVDVRCRAELIELDGIPAARLFVAGRLQLDGSVRDLPETRADDVTLTAKLPPKLPRHIALGAGLSTRPALIVNGTFYRQGKRLGWWGQYEHGATEWNAAGGVTWRF